MMPAEFPNPSRMLRHLINAKDTNHYDAVLAAESLGCAFAYMVCDRYELAGTRLDDVQRMMIGVQ